ncbi:MAG: hypothetical protein KZQ95_02095 [Candidatus Thiodiazotropha sp. (ex Epidulcina cf. delphinae)]|nr:hypothetical protein [Candidatus Thiodiazotropha sp. (ex Epidulcina cf. delphinae)]
MHNIPSQRPARFMDIWHEVPLVPQQTGMSCWAAAAAMLVGWRECLHSKPDAIAQGAGHWQAYQNGLDPHSIVALSQQWRLYPLDYEELTPEALKRILYEVGPLWVGEASPGLHSVVITGIYGDGSPQGSFVRINDPWPIGQGERYSKSVAALTRDLRTAAEKVGRHIQVLHSGGRKPVPFRAPPSAVHRPVDSSHQALAYGRPDHRGFQSPPIPAGFFNFEPWPVAPDSETVNQTRPVNYRWSVLPGQELMLDVVIVELTPRDTIASPRHEKMLLRYTETIINQAKHPTLLIACLSSQKADGPIPLSAQDPQGHQVLIFEAVNWLQRNLVGSTGSSLLSIRNASHMRLQGPGGSIELRAAGASI